MTRVQIIGLIGVVGFLVLAPMPARSLADCDTVGSDVASIREISTAIYSAFANSDAAALAGLVTEDAVWMPPEEPTITGRAAIEKRYANLFGELHNRFKDISHSLEVDEVRVCGDWAMSRGRYRLKMTLLTVPRTIVITGKNIHTYLRQSDGSWLIASDIWNSDAPVRRGPEQ